MAEGDGAVYQVAKADFLKADIDLVDDTIKVGLVGGYTLDEDGHTTWTAVKSAATGGELSGTGYSAGGATLASNSVTATGTGTGTTVKGKFDADNVTWSSVSCGTPSHAVMYDDTHTAKHVIAAWEVTTATNGGNYTLTWNASGIITIS